MSEWHDVYIEKHPLVEETVFRSWVLEDNDDVLVINKPGWLVCHPSKAGPRSSLVGAAREIIGIDMLHLVARLDRETSGLVVLAKHRAAARRLQMAMQNRFVNKRYHAILEGELAERTEVSKALVDDVASPVAVKLKVAEAGEGQQAQTTFLPLVARNGFTLAEVRPFTGRKHQIRVHAQSIGHPIVGDKLYGHDERIYLQMAEKGWSPELAERLQMPRHALHCTWLEFPGEGGPVSYFAPLQNDFLGFCEDRMGLSGAEVETLLAASPPATRDRRRGRKPRRRNG